MRGVTLFLRPVDRCFLSAKSAKHLIALGLDHIIIDARTFRPSFWPSLYVNICHYGAPILSDLVWRQDREYPTKGSLGGWKAFVNAKRKKDVL
jgi:hypothetical protein